MKSINLIIFITVFTIFYPVKNFGNVFSKMLIEQNYSSYMAAVDTMKDNDMALLLKSVYYNQYMIDYYNNSYEDSLDYILKKINDIPLSDDENCFVKGGVYLNYAFYMQFKGNIWSALKYGNRGAGYLRRIGPKSRYYNDALLGVAIYDYGVGKLFFRKSKINKGLKELSLVADKGNYFDLIAKNLKILLLYNEGRYKEGLKESLQMKEEFPGSRLILWDVVKGFGFLNEQDSLIVYSNYLINNIKDDTSPNNYNLLTVYNWQIKAYLKTGNAEKAKEIFEKVCNVSVKNQYARDIKKLKSDIINRYRSKF